jgi:hypothetical protein
MRRRRAEVTPMRRVPAVEMIDVMEVSIVTVE